MTPDELWALAEAAPDAPWRFSQYDGLIRDAEDYHIVQIAGSPRNSQLAAAGRLIALAPDLARLYAEQHERLAFIARLPILHGETAANAMQREARAALASLAVLEAPK
jgi:hypothetical protein